MSQSAYVCARCGVSVGYWAYGWKHQNGGYGNRSCGRPPKVIERETYERDIQTMVDAVQDFASSKKKVSAS